jgi:O-antigen/teichoic acid export membrane protein
VTATSDGVTVDAHEAERRHARWDVQSAPRNYVTLVVNQAVSICASFGAVLLASRLLGPGGYGLLVAVMAAASLVMQLAVQWSATSVTRFGVEEFVRSGRIASTFWGRGGALAIKLALVAATLPLWFPVVARWFHVADEDRGALLAYLIASATWLHLQQSLQAAKLPRLQATLLTVERLLLLGSLLAMLLLGGATPRAVLMAYVLPSVVVSTIALIRLRRLILPIGSSLDVVRRILRFSLPLMPTALVGYLASSQLDSIFILRYLSESALGRYAIAYQVAGAFMQLPLLAGTLVLPLLLSTAAARREQGLPPEALGMMRDILPAATLLWSAACIVAGVAGYYLLPLVIGARFEGAAELLSPLMAVSAISGPVLMGLFPLANAYSMTHIIAINATLGAIANVGLDVLLIPRFGLLGCAWATVLAAVCSLLITDFFVSRKVLRGSTWVVEATLAPIAVALLALRLPSLGASALGLLLICVQAYRHRRSIRVAVATIASARKPRAAAEASA